MIGLSWRVTGLDVDVDVDDAGALSLTVDATAFLLGWCPTHLRDRDGLHALGRPTLQRLPDEVELTWTLARTAGDLVITGRHSFSMVWSQRWVIRRVTRTDPAAIAEQLHLRLSHQVGPGAICWVFAGGVESSASVQPYSPELPILGLSTQVGSLTVVDDALELGPYALGSTDAAVVELRADLFDHAAAFSRTVHTWLPASTYLGAGEPVVITHPDAGLVMTDPESPADGDVDVAGDGDGDVDEPRDPLPSAAQVLAGAGTEQGSEFIAGSDSERRLIFHGARGQTEVTLHWAKPLGEAITTAASTLLAGPRAANGVPVLTDPQSGLLVQRAVADHAELDGVDTADVLDALDLLASRDPQPTPWQVMFDCAEFHRTGDDDLLIRAHRQLLRTEPQAGTGLAASRLVVALLSVGRNPAAVLDRLQQARVHTEDDDVRLELALVTGTVLGAGHEPDSAIASTRQLAEVAVRLGSGLRGRAVPDLVPVDRARLLSLLALLPELAMVWQDRLAATPGRLVQYTAHRVLYELEVGVGSTAADRQTLVWLSLADDA